jgi:hypothetical protein
MNRLFFITILTLIFSCSKSDDNNDEMSVCEEKDFLETFIVEPNDCFIFDDPLMTFTFVSFDNFTKTNLDETPYARIIAKILIDDLSWEFPHKIYEDTESDGSSFLGFVNAGINDNIYTIHFDEIEFTETETQYIFHRAIIRLEKYED